MSYCKANPLFELDIYRSRIDYSWNFFLSVFRWSFSIQLSKGIEVEYSGYLDGNYSSHEAHASEHNKTANDFEDEIKAWYEEDSVEGEEHDDHDYHELEGVYYSHFFEHFVEVRQFNEDPLFEVEHQQHPLLMFPSGHKEKVMPIAIERNLKDGLWEKVISP